MGWEVVKRQDSFQGSNRPFIRISKAHIAFNAVFSRIAELDLSKRVTIYADTENRKLAFEFHTDEKPDSLALSPSSSSKKGDKRCGYFCAALGVVNQYSWVEAVTRLPANDKRFYDPKKESGKWVLQLCPAFEIKRARESAKIPSDAKGVYRYLREDGEIVYIGRGEIKKRLSSPGRDEWDFDTIEYSLLEDPDQQIYWEDYWLEKFKNINQKLPVYNKVSGARISIEPEDEDYGR
ncbi:hypothetical protein ACFL5F_02710 [Planctomycetota bacterium]